MPCNSDHMNATTKERDLSRVACLLDELIGLPMNRTHWAGYHPDVYNRVRVDADALVARLCDKLQGQDVTKYSLEMQIWWSDHQAADAARIEREQAKAAAEATRKAALEKLTPEEREALGL